MKFPRPLADRSLLSRAWSALRAAVLVSLAGALTAAAATRPTAALAADERPTAPRRGQGGRELGRDEVEHGQTGISETDRCVGCRRRRDGRKNRERPGSAIARRSGAGETTLVGKIARGKKIAAGKIAAGQDCAG